MRKSLLTILFLFVGLNLFGQNGNNTTSDDSLIVKAENGLRNEKINNTGLKPTIDFLQKFPEIVLRSYTYPKYYRTEREFAVIIERINNLGVTTEDLHSEESDSILHYCFEIKDHRLGCTAFIYFIEHFLPTDDTDLISYVEFKDPSYNLRLSTDNSIEAEAWGDLSAFQFDFKKSMYHYLRACKIYENQNDFESMGYVNSKIANLYLKLDNSKFFNTAAEHFNEASEDFKKANNNTQSIIAKLNAYNVSGLSYDDNISLFEINGYYRSRHRGEDYSVEDIQDEINDQQFAYNRKMKLFDFVLMRISQIDTNEIASPYYYQSIGDYFFQKREYKVAIKYFEYALTRMLSSTVNDKDFELNKLTNLLNKLSFAYYFLGDETGTNTYMNLAIQLNEKAGDKFALIAENLKYASFLINVGKTNEGGNLIGKTLNIQDSFKISPNRQAYLDLISSQFISALGTKVNDSNLLSRSVNLHNEKRLFFDKIGDDMINLETEFKQKIAVSKLGSQINTLEKSSDSLRAQRSLMLKNILGLISTRDSLSSNNTKLENSNDTLSRNGQILSLKNGMLSSENDSLVVQKIAKQKELNKMSNRLLYALYIIVILVAISTAIFFTYRTIVKAREEKIVNTRAELNTLAKGKFHNVKNRYGKFLYLIDANNVPGAIAYASRSSKYISYALDNINYEAKGWTLANEVELLNRFVYAQEILTPNIKVENDLTKPNRLNLAKIRFIPDIFTTIFDNSVLYGFDKLKDGRECIFSIKFRIARDLLCFEISDNGEPAKRLKSYEIPNDPNRGINLLRRRVETELLLNSKTRNLHPEFYAGPNENNIGSIVKFSFPYEIST